MSVELAVLVSSFERPWHLQRVLWSLASQRGVAGRFEVVVTDDGSRDETLVMLARLARRLDFPLRFTTHRHADFQLARCRNEGVAATTAPYLLFLDGDCLAPPDHLAQHLQRRREGVVWGGFCYRLEQGPSEQVDEWSVRSGRFQQLASPREIRKLRILAAKSWLYSWLRHPTKPRLFGGNIGIHRSDYERVNGYDERFVGWGGEDDDLRIRLRQAGITIRSILPWTRTYHLWHPPVPSAPQSTRQGRNIAYLDRGSRPTRCEQGLRQRREAMHRDPNGQYAA